MVHYSSTSNEVFGWLSVKQPRSYVPSPPNGDQEIVSVSNKLEHWTKKFQENNLVNHILK